MAEVSWRQDFPVEIPITLYWREDFVQTLAFDNPINTFPAGTTVGLLLFAKKDDPDPVAVWAADVGADTAKWTVDCAEVQELWSDLKFYRLLMSVPNPDDVDNPSYERCLALGAIIRK